MSFKYNPKDATSCLAAGDYQATLQACDEGRSKANNPMLKVVWTVYTMSGGTRQVFDYIVNPATLWKLKRIAKALGKESDFNAGTFDLAAHLGSNITLQLRVKEDAEYGEKNEVGGYSPSAISGSQQQAQPVRDAKAGVAKALTGATTIEPDDIPF